MNPVIDAIKSRRSRRKVVEDRSPTKEQIEQILGAATWAPNHHLTEPWRFVVISGNARKSLGQAMAESLSAEPSSQGNGTETIPSKDKLVDLEKTKPMRAPVLITLILSPQLQRGALPQEETLACGAALQNMLLAAHSLGLGAAVKTGKSAYSKEVRAYLGLRSEESVAGFVYLGYPDGSPPTGKRSGLAAKVEWRES